MLSLSESPIVRALDRVISRTARLSALRDRAAGLRAWATEDDARRRKLLLGTGAGALVVVLGMSAGAYFVLRPMPQPDYENDSIYRVFKYTLLTDEFNKLSVEERLKLIGMIRERLDGLSKSESTLLAAFAAGIVGKTRDQLEENVSRLMIDTWDMHATDYAHVPAADRESFVDGAFVQIHEMMDMLDNGRMSNQTPEQRLAEGREQAQRDLEMMKSGDGPSARMMSRLYRILNDGVGSHASPQQQVRGRQLMRDMTRRLRGQPLSGPG